MKRHWAGNEPSAVTRSLACEPVSKQLSPDDSGRDISELHFGKRITDRLQKAGVLKFADAAKAYDNGLLRAIFREALTVNNNPPNEEKIEFQLGQFRTKMYLYAGIRFIYGFQPLPPT